MKVYNSRMNPIDTEKLRKAWTDYDHKMVTHSEECHLWHYSCAIQRLCDELDHERKNSSAYYNMARDSILNPPPTDDEYWER